ncbi:hypothetical protein EC973_003143 [Apophysomyces ossiformis]|uniref:Uncharacterized protein n=1 Tax=Apophysomyces ossiformis TaxID=679940 RepID=A0A8H7BI82_9FUNG|nr:hypothetical protein EC973_003143 [Apophysomyces ossiformis]
MVAGSGNYFSWDTSASQFTVHPANAYAAAAAARTPRNFSRPNNLLTRPNTSRRSDNSQQKLKIEFALYSTSHISIKADYNETLLPALRNIDNASWDAEQSKWMIPATIDAYNRALQMLPLKTPNLNIDLSPLPPTIVQLMKEEAAVEETREVREADVAELLCRVQPSKLWNRLKPFQKAGVCEGLNRNGRVLLGDEMGLGKTVQALAISLAYSDEWPVLVICPSSLRLTWKAEIIKWLDLSDDQVHVSIKSSDMFKSPEAGQKRKSTSRPTARKRAAASTGPRRIGPTDDSHDVDAESSNNVKFYVTSYDLAMKNATAINDKQFKFVICDESHYLKNRLAKRTTKIVPIVQKAKRALLLSGTPLLSRPIDLFPQLTALRSDLFPEFSRFGLRYCNARHNVFGWDYSGASNLAELKYAMEMSVLVRRLKKDVLLELPEKTRQSMIVNIAEKDKSEMRTMMKKINQLNADLKNSRTTLRNKQLAMEAKQQLMTEMYAKSGTAKIPAVTDIVEHLFEKSTTSKILVFAHHRNVMNAIEQLSEKRKIDFIRIDGTTNQQSRQALCEKFQTTANVRIAILSITAANAGLTLNVADIVLFAELFWNPSQLLQAEDRAHRIGRVGPVEIKYVLAMDTIDTHQWDLVKKKLKVIGETLDGYQAENTLKASEQPRRGQNSSFLRSIGAYATDDSDQGSDSEDDELDLDEEFLAELTHAAELAEQQPPQEANSDLSQAAEQNTSPTTPTPSGEMPDTALCS